MRGCGFSMSSTSIAAGATSSRASSTSSAIAGASWRPEVLGWISRRAGERRAQRDPSADSGAFPVDARLSGTAGVTTARRFFVLRACRDGCRRHPARAVAVGVGGGVGLGVHAEVSNDWQSLLHARVPPRNPRLAQLRLFRLRPAQTSGLSGPWRKRIVDSRRSRRRRSPSLTPFQAARNSTA
jgi:hypothetical protein